MYDIFISYSSINQYIADAICNYMESGGLKCWYAPRNIAVGDDWPAAIIRAIHQSKIFVLIYSADSNKSKQVIREVAAAVESECVIVPFRIDESQMCDSLSYYLSGVHWMDAMNATLEEAIGNLYQRVWYMVYAPQTTQKQEHSATSSTAKPSKKNGRKKRFWWIALAVLGAICLMAGAVLLLPETETQQTIPFYNLSQLEQFDYPFYEYKMFDDPFSAYFVRNRETGILSCVKTDTGYRIMEDIDYTPEDPYQVRAIMADHYDAVYFLEEEQGLVKIYNRTTDTWVSQEGVSLGLRSQEFVRLSLLNSDYIGSGNAGEVCFMIYDGSTDTDCYTRAVKVYPDGRRDNIDIRRLGLKAYAVGIDKPGYNLVAMLDRQNNLKLLDLNTMSILDVSYERMLVEFLPYHTEDARTISETGRYLCLHTETPTGVHVTVWDLQMRRQVMSKTYTKNHSVYFMGESTLLIFNGEDTTLTEYDLKTDKSVLRMDKNDFAENPAYSTIPFAFLYTGEPDVFFFTSAAKTDAGGLGVVVTMTDHDGKVLAQSEVLEILHKNSYVNVYASNGMIFFSANMNDPYQDALDGVCTLVYRVKYTYNAQGELVFIQ